MFIVSDKELKIKGFKAMNKRNKMNFCKNDTSTKEFTCVIVIGNNINEDIIVDEIMDIYNCEQQWCIDTSLIDSKELGSLTSHLINEKYNVCVMKINNAKVSKHSLYRVLGLIELLVHPNVPFHKLKLKKKYNQEKECFIDMIEKLVIKEEDCNDTGK